MPRIAYRAAARLAHRLPISTGKFAESVAGRRRARDRWLEWAREHSGTTAPLLWVHAASVGETLTAGPIVARVRTARPDLVTVLTFSSPSVARWPHLAGISRADYAPLDEPSHVTAVVDAMQPDLLLCSRGELWPEFVAAAQQRAVPVAVVGGSVRPRSRRLRWPVRNVLRPVCQRLAYVGAVSDADAARWRTIGAPPNVVRTTGDPRHDQVVDRIPSLVPMRHLRRWAGSRPVLLAGSVEPEDEVPLLGAQEQLGTPLVLVPHEPRHAAVQRLLARVPAHSPPRHRTGWDGTGHIDPAACVVVVTATGLLADLYAAADIAYVGGGHRPGRLHTVLEPAVFGVPVVTGPGIAEAPDAEAMQRTGGLVALPGRGTSLALADIWRRWIESPRERERAGLAARSVIRPGAAGADTAALLALLPPKA